MIQGDINMNIKNKLNSLGIIILFLGIAGIAESFTGHGSIYAGIAWILIGFIFMILGYDPKNNEE